MRAPAKSSGRAPASALLVAGATAALVGGCHFDAPPDLLAVHRVSPARASAGDRVTLAGEGFPDGRPAKVTFSGDLLRAGAAPIRDVRIDAAAQPSGRNAVIIPFDADLESRFTGKGETAVHATFRGDVRVLFEPAQVGLTAISGTARAIRFDVLPSASGPLSIERLAEGERGLAFVGLTGSADPSGAGLRVEGVAEGGRAAAAGFAPSDLLVEIDGVTSLSAADVRVPAGTRRARVSVERGGRTLLLDLDVEGLAPLTAADLVPAATALLLACVAVALPATRLWLPLRWLARLAEARRGNTRWSHAAPGLFDVLLPPLAEGRALQAAAALVLGAIALGFVWLSTGRSVLSPDLDLVASALGASVALVATRFVDGGGRREGAWSLLEAIRAAASSLACVMPALAAVGGAILASGRFVLAEMVAEQGAAPWRWAATRNPGLAILLVLLLAAAVPETDDRGVALPVEGFPASPSRGGSSRALVRLAEWSYLWTMAGLGVVLLLGGWRIPLASSVSQEASRALTAIGAVVLLAKMAVVALLVAQLRRTASRVYLEHVAPMAWRWGLPASLAALALAASWAAALEGGTSQTLAELAGYTSAALGAGALALALSSGFGSHKNGRPMAVASVNPWL